MLIATPGEVDCSAVYTDRKVLGHIKQSMEASIPEVVYELETVMRATRHRGSTLKSMAKSMANIYQTCKRIPKETKHDHRKAE